MQKGISLGNVKGLVGTDYPKVKDEQHKQANIKGIGQEIAQPCRIVCQVGYPHYILHLFLQCLFLQHPSENYAATIADNCHRQVERAQEIIAARILENHQECPQDQHRYDFAQKLFASVADQKILPEYGFDLTQVDCHNIIKWQTLIDTVIIKLFRKMKDRKYSDASDAFLCDILSKKCNQFLNSCGNPKGRQMLEINQTLKFTSNQTKNSKTIITKNKIVYSNIITQSTIR